MAQKNIIITGATGNLGAATVEKFLQEGYTVSAIISHGKTLQSKKNLFTYQADLVKEIEANSAVEKIISDHTNVHGAVLTVGGFTSGTIESTSMNDIVKMMELNFYTGYNVVRPLIKHFKNKNDGRVVLVGARPALEASGGKTAVGYTLSKALIFKLAELLNADVSEKNVRTSILVPNIIDTIANRKAMPNSDFSKWNTSDDIAETIHQIINAEVSNDIVKLY